MDRDERIAYLKETITEKNDALLRSLSKMSDLNEKLSELKGPPPSDRSHDSIESLNKSIASVEESKQLLKDEIAEYKAELKQLEGGGPILLSTPGIITIIIIDILLHFKNIFKWSITIFNYVFMTKMSITCKK